MEEETKEKIWITVDLIAMVCNPGCWIGWALMWVYNQLDDNLVGGYCKMWGWKF